MRAVILAFLTSGYLIFSLGCQFKEYNEKLPVIGNRHHPDGTIEEHYIRDFSFINQLGDTITQDHFLNKVYIADFFFTSCPSICPKVAKQMLRIYDYVSDDDNVLLVSHTIDPYRDTPEVLRLYAENMEVDHNKWLFLTGDKDELLDINLDYFIAAFEDPDAPGGFDHSGKIVMIDPNRQVRAFCEGTDPSSVTKFFKDIDKMRFELVDK